MQGSLVKFDPCDGETRSADGSGMILIAMVMPVKHGWQGLDQRQRLSGRYGDRSVDRH
jgi:hypothetical protein